MSQDHDATPTAAHANRPRFDPTINLGHIITFIGFIAAGMAAYNGIDKRLALLEQFRVMQVSRDAEQDAAVQAQSADIRASQRRIEDKLDRLAERLPPSPHGGQP